MEEGERGEGEGVRERLPSMETSTSMCGKPAQTANMSR